MQGALRAACPAGRERRESRDGGKSRPADGPRRFVPASRARRGAHARRLRAWCSRARRRHTTSSWPRSSAGSTSCRATASGSRSSRSSRAAPSGSTIRIFNIGYHVRHTALAARRAARTELKRLAGRVFSQELDRAKPLWELWLVERLEGDRFACSPRPTTALVDGVSGVDIATVLFDTESEPERSPRRRTAVDARAPSPPARSCWPRRCSSAPPCPARSRAACGRSLARHGSARQRGVGRCAG